MRWNDQSKFFHFQIIAVGEARNAFFLSKQFLGEKRFLLLGQLRFGADTIWRPYALAPIRIGAGTVRRPTFWRQTHLAYTDRQRRVSGAVRRQGDVGGPASVRRRGDLGGPVSARRRNTDATPQRRISHVLGKHIFYGRNQSVFLVIFATVWRRVGKK